MTARLIIIQVKPMWLQMP
ncbi:hypothetical protein MTR67_031083 [Solanum verrucosum]|uniref:Uncharacterized protein n=1 Tax=Solanum verrucosum TaxID=315347 RepID=A0AAF0ZFL3_SOLVR|nr:hypothetical protein MTR67_031083 [Solanum verrucosum]